MGREERAYSKLAEVPLDVKTLTVRAGVQAFPASRQFVNRTSGVLVEITNGGEVVEDVEGAETAAHNGATKTADDEKKQVQ